MEFRILKKISTATPCRMANKGEIKHEQRLGGIISYDYRDAA